MTFDWFTLFAQLFNFALLLVLLRIFLYRPLLATMAEREALATSALDEARTMRLAAEKERRSLESERAREQSERDTRRQSLAEELERLRQERLDSIVREAEKLRATTLQALEHEVDSALDRLRAGLATIVLDEVQDTIKWIAGEDLHRHALSAFLERLRHLPEERRAELAAGAAAHGVRVTTPQPLDDDQQEAVRNAVAEVLPAREVRFETAEDLLLGVVLDAGGLRLDGSAAARLETLSQRFARVLGDLGHVGRETVA